MTPSANNRKVTRSADLPEFERPPLNELVLSIQYPAAKLRNIDIGVLWHEFREQYPTVEEQQPLPPAFETFGLPSPPQDRVTLITGAEVMRYWFITASGNELLQVQPDRLIHNWRKQKEEDEYPRYEPIRERFEREVGMVQAFLTKNKLGEIKPNQCEVSYYNHITLVDSSDPSDQLDKVFTIWSEAYSDDYLKRIERGQFSMSYLIPAPQGKSDPFGRLHVAVQSAMHNVTRKRFLRLSLIARGKPASESVESALSWLDEGRNAIVRAFASLTRAEMHKQWGRK